MSVWRFDAIGTRWEIESEHDLTPAERARVSSVIDGFDATWSRFRADSLVERLRQSPGTVPAPADAAAMLDAYRELDAATVGAVNPTVGGALEALGYDATVSLRVGAATPAPGGWQRAVWWTPEELQVTAPVLLDVGALGKGRLVDLVVDALYDVDGRLVVDASGDLRVRDGSTRVALEHPYDLTSAIGVVEVSDGALCASATNRRAWGGGLHHVLDARTGMPVRTWAATWAIGPDAMRADAVATALFFDGGAELAARWGIEWVRMSTDGRAERSAGFDGTLFTGNARE